MDYKGLSFALIIAIPASAHAFDLSPDNTRYLSDPAFLPLAGQIFGHSSYTYREMSQDVVYPDGVVYPHYWGRSNLLSQDISYGITDRLSFNASLSHDDQYQKGAYPFGSIEYYSHGFNNPAFGVTWRAAEQDAFPVDLDVTATYTPNAFSARQATSVSGGTVASGGHAGELNMAVSRTMTSLTLQAYAVATYFGAEKRSIPIDGSTITTDSHWAYGFGLRSQARLTNRFFLNAGAGFTGQTDASVSAPIEVIAYRSSYDPSVAAYVAAGYHLIPNRLVLSARYERQYRGDEAAIADSTTIATVKAGAENIYGIHVRFLFF